MQPYTRLAAYTFTRPSATNLNPHQENTVEPGWASALKPPKHLKGVDPDLVGPKAYSHPAVHRWWKWIVEEYRPPSQAALLTPCSNVKPYTRSPTSRKIRAMLRRLGLWDPTADKPKSITWLYLSDLLGLVPYEHAEDYPACCYEVPPQVALRVDGALERIADVVCRAIENHGYRILVTFLPKAHRKIVEEARKQCSYWPQEIQVAYTIFGTGKLEAALRQLLGIEG